MSGLDNELPCERCQCNQVEVRLDCASRRCLTTTPPIECVVAVSRHWHESPQEARVKSPRTLKRLVLAAGFAAACASGGHDQGVLGIQLNVPRSAIPGTGLCRIWLTGVPTSRQPMVQGCDGIEYSAPLGSRVLYRPDDGSREVHVSYMSRATPGWVTGIDAFSIDTMRLVRVILPYVGEPPQLIEELR